MNDHERLGLLSFVDHTRQIMVFVIRERLDLTESELHHELNDGLREVEPHFGAVLEAIGSGRYDRQLDAAGLSGSQLNLKLKGVGRAIARFRLTPTRRVLSKALDWINSILGSLATAVPGVEPIKELKEALHNSLREEE
jgi:hypothetical protein